MKYEINTVTGNSLVLKTEKSRDIEVTRVKWKCCFLQYYVRFLDHTDGYLFKWHTHTVLELVVLGAIC